MTLPLEGKVAIVTGSSRGIGKAIAIQLAQDGADVVVCGRSEAPGELPGTIGETTKAIGALGRRSLALRADLTEDSDVRNLIEQTLHAFDHVDILVNNAGLIGGGAFLGGDVGLLDTFYRTNIRAPYLLAQLLAEKMVATGGGTIINITSGAARLPGLGIPPSAVLYGMTKAALDRFGMGIAGELKAKNVAVINVNPGPTITERSLAPGRDNSGRLPAEVTAKVVAFLCREPMSHTGKIFNTRDVAAEQQF